MRFDDYLASDGWTLKYYLRGVGSQDITASTDTDGEGYSVTLPAVTTAALAAGNYQFLARVSNVGGEAYTVDSGIVDVAPNAATAAAGALQSHAEQMVTLLKAEIKARLSGTAGTGHNDYTIDGRSISKFSLVELRGMLKGYEFELSAQKNGGHLPPYRVGFSRA